MRIDKQSSSACRGHEDKRRMTAGIVIDRQMVDIMVLEEQPCGAAVMIFGKGNDGESLGVELFA